MPKIDLILIHAPAVYDFRKETIMFGPISDMVPSTPVFEMYPLGFVTIGEYLERKGLRVRIINLASLMLHNKDFNVEKYLATLDCEVFGIDLHWLPHCHGSIEVARIVKRLHPQAAVVFGGFTASFYHEELIAEDAVDFVLRGDSTEAPFAELVWRIKRGGRKGYSNFSDIPNLTWKDLTGSVQINELNWVPADMNAVSLDYAFPMKSVIRHRNLSSTLPTKGWLQYPVCAAITCRGCTYNCATCGGSATAFKRHFGRAEVAFRDPEFLARDIRTIQRYIGGPIFLLNDFLQAGEDYANKLIESLRGSLKNPIGFELFGPPREGADFYRRLDANLPDWSVEISVESHDDAVRAAFGKGHYNIEAVEETIADALNNGCKRFDLYFMSGIPTQTADSVRQTADYVRQLYEKFNYDKRLLVFLSPMAPFLDPGSRVFDDPDTFGYKLRARSLAEHRERMTMPSWKYIMNYESDAMSTDQLVEVTYEVARKINRIKGQGGIVDSATAETTDKRIAQAAEQMSRLDDLMMSAHASREIAVFKEEAERLSQSTVAEKTELNWPHSLKLEHLINCGALGVKQLSRGVAAAFRGELASAASDITYPDQTCSEK